MLEEITQITKITEITHYDNDNDNDNENVDVDGNVDENSVFFADAQKTAAANTSIAF